MNGYRKKLKHLTLKKIIEKDYDKVESELEFIKEGKYTIDLDSQENQDKLFQDSRYRLKARDKDYGFKLEIRWISNKRKRQSVQDEIDGLLHGRYQLTIDKIEVEFLEELQEDGFELTRRNRRDQEASRRQIVSDFPLFIDGSHYTITVTYKYITKSMGVEVSLNGKQINSFKQKGKKLKKLDALSFAI